MTIKPKLLLVFAHPDDESVGMCGTLTKYSAPGVETYLIYASSGAMGWFAPEEQNAGSAALSQIHTQELENAVRELGLLQESHRMQYGQYAETAGCLPSPGR